MTNELPKPEEKPLNARQLAFARELGVAMAKGDRDFTRAYQSAGYAADRGNAARLASDPRVKAIADRACEEAARLNGLHIGYLQAKAMQLLDATATAIYREIGRFIEVVRDVEGNPVSVHFRQNLSPAECAELDAATWALSDLKIDKDGVVAIKLPDKKALIEMLAKQLGVGKDDHSVNVDVTLEALVAQSMQTKEREAA